MDNTKLSTFIIYFGFIIILVVFDSCHNIVFPILFKIQAVLQLELHNMWEFLQHGTVRLPLNPAIEVTGVDAKVGNQQIIITSVGLIGCLYLQC